MIGFIIEFTAKFGVLIAISVFLIKSLEQFVVVKHVFDIKNFPIYILMGWICIGFAFGLDQDESCGCRLQSRSIGELAYIAYSSLSMLLVISTFVWTKKRRFLIVLETLLWLLKLIFLKSGYSVGITGEANLSILFYDYIGLLIRLGLIVFLFQFSWIKTSYLPFLVAIIIDVKSSIFPCQNDIIQQKIFSPILSNRIITKLNGNWTGTANWDILITERTQMKDEESTFDQSKASLQKNDSVYVPTNISLTVSKTQRIVARSCKLQIQIDRNSISIRGIAGVSSRKMSLSNINPSVNSVLYYRYNDTSSKDESCTFKILNLSEQRLEATINDLFKIEVKKNK